MKAITLAHTKANGWQPELPTELDSDRTMVLAFGGSELIDRPRVLQELAEAFPQSHLMGCSTGGEILGPEVHDGCLAVAIVRFEHTSLARAFAVARADSSFKAGRDLASQLVGPSLRLVFVLADGIDINGTDLVAGLNEGLPDDVVVTGGLAADGDRFRRTWVMGPDGPATKEIAAIGFYGDRFRVGHGSRGGWDIFGPERLVTRSDGRVLYELDGKPALALYKTYLGELASGLPATGLLFPLALRPADGSAGEGKERQVVRTILAVDEVDQSMTFAGEIPEGHLAQLMKANFDRVIGGAWHAALVARDREPGVEGGLVIAVSCVGRRWLLGERTEEELEHTLDVLPDGIQQIGYYSYGELSPVGSGACDLHNQTMTLTTIAEG
jgi:hypothetical protein